MKTQLVLALTLILPTICVAQQYQISSPGMQPMATPHYQPAVAGPSYQPVAAPAPNHSMAPAPRFNMAPPATGFSGGCDSGGCDVGGGFVGGGYDGGTGIDCGYGDCCGSGKCCGVYFSAFSGYAELDDQNSVGYARDLLVDYNPGWAVGGAIGKRLCRNVRMELEYTFRNQSVDQVQFNGNFPGNESGFQASHAGMLNFAYDLVLGNGKIVPYIGGGIGVASIDSRVRYGNGVATLDGDDSSVAYQWMAGISLRRRPNMEIFAEYRFFEIDDPKLNRFGGPAIGTVGGMQTPNPNILLESEYNSQDIMAGIRFSF